ncbi:MAG: amidohydrolase family protein [Pseudomonadota bacterium]
MDLSSIPILDHHAHPLLKPEATRDVVGFRQWFTESTDPDIHANHVPHSLFFRTAIRWLAEALDCEPTLEAVLSARAAQSAEAWPRRLFTEANIEMMLCDYGYRGPDSYDHEEMQALLPCDVIPILRIETLAQTLILQYDTFAQMNTAFMETISRAKADGYIAFKSIIAYRSGLDTRPTPYEAAEKAFEPLKAAADKTGQARLESQPLCDYLLWQVAAQAEVQALPIQIHTGFGDRDADLRQANPLHLRRLIEETRCQIVLLHAGWPFYRETAHLAAIYPNAWREPQSQDLLLQERSVSTGIPDSELSCPSRSPRLSSAYHNYTESRYGLVR